ncbi:MAG TPA: plastocyanin/azurin family copper-binding protein [Acidimicrobiia bacterium]|nr:plastocyanin/azurin family copper-binding protein [Acidimicrobiia bacterium]
MRRLLLITVAMGLMACSGTDSTTEPETTTTVPDTTTTTASTTTSTTETSDPEANLNIVIVGFRFSGDDTGNVGDTVLVVNEDTVGHTWTATGGEFHSGVLSSGETFTFTFDQPGEYGFFCQIHPEMAGSISIES